MREIWGRIRILTEQVINLWKPYDYLLEMSCSWAENGHTIKGKTSKEVRGVSNGKITEFELIRLAGYWYVCCDTLHLIQTVQSNILVPCMKNQSTICNQLCVTIKHNCLYKFSFKDQQTPINVSRLSQIMF